jgi:hypothetical protein
MLSLSRLVGAVEERRKSQRRVTPDRRKGPRRIKQLSIGIERRTTGERRKGERRVLADRREEATRFTCPVCKARIVGSNPLLSHLVEMHRITNRQATILTEKMAEWKQQRLDPTLFP